MKITEMQDKLEEMQGELLIISETATAIETSLSGGNLDSSQVEWAFIGIIRNVDKLAKDIENLVKEVIEMRSIIKNL